MVEFLKAKQTTFRNRPLGVVPVDTGAIQAAQTLSRVSGDLATMYFKEATEKEMEKGRDYVSSLPTRTEIVDELGVGTGQYELNFQKLDTSLSKVAQQTAQPLLRKKYGIALANDVNRNINKLRLESKTSAEFQEKIDTFIPEYEKQITNLGGGEYVNQIRESVAKLSTQHFFDMALKENRQNLIEEGFNTIEIIGNSAKDLSAEATQIYSFENVDEELKSLKVVQNDLLNNLDAAYSDGNGVGITRTQYNNQKRNIQTAIPLGLLKSFSGNKDTTQMRGAVRYLNSGVKIKELNADDYKTLDLIKKESGSNIDVIVDEARQVSSNVSNIESGRRVKENQEDELERKIAQERKEDPQTQINYTEITQSLELETDDLASEYVETGNINLNKITEFYNRIDNAVGVKNEDPALVEKYGKGNGFVNLSLKQAGALKELALTETVRKVFQSGEIINNAQSLGKIIAKVANPSKNISLTEGEEKFYNLVNDISERGHINKSSTQSAIQDVLNRVISQSGADARNNTQIRETDRVIKDIDNDLFDTSSKKDREIVDNVFAITNPNLFKDGSYDPQNDDNHRSIDYYIMKKAVVPQTLIKSMSALADGRITNNQEAMRLLSIYGRYSQVRTRNTLTSKNNLVIGGMSTKVNQTLSVVAELYSLAQGQTSFFDIKGTGANEQIQLVDIINKVNSNKTNPPTINYERYGDKVNSAKDYLAKLGYKTFEIQDLDEAAKIGMSLGIEKETLDDVMNEIRDNVYGETEGIVIDVFYSTSLDRSRYALTNSVPDDVKREKIKNLINSKLPDDVMLNNTTYSVEDAEDSVSTIQEELGIADEEFVGKRPKASSFRIGTDSSESLIARMEQRDVAEPLRRKKTKEAIQTVKNVAYLVPYTTAFTGGDVQNRNVQYQVATLNEYGTLQPLRHNGEYFIYDIKSLLDEIKTTKEINASLDVFTSPEERSKAKVTKVLGGIK